MNNNDNNNNNNNNNNKRLIIIIILGQCLCCCHHDKVIATVHTVHLMNVEQRQAAADSQTKPHDLGCESACRLLSSTSTIVIYYYSTRKLILTIIYRTCDHGFNCRKKSPFQ